MFAFHGSSVFFDVATIKHSTSCETTSEKGGKGQKRGEEEFSVRVSFAEKKRIGK